MNMKNILILLFSLALASLCGNAQTPPPASGQQTLSKKNLVIKEWNADARGANKRLDHQTTYNADGKKLEEIEYGSAGQKWRKRYEYSGGKCVKEMVYNERNKLVTIKKYEYNELGKKKVQYNYDAQGKLLTIKTFEYISRDAD